MNPEDEIVEIKSWGSDEPIARFVAGPFGTEDRHADMMHWRP